eukprot:1639652-Prymnesium_polylepis.2
MVVMSIHEHVKLQNDAFSSQMRLNHLKKFASALKTPARCAHGTPIPSPSCIPPPDPPSSPRVPGRGH